MRKYPALYNGIFRGNKYKHIITSLILLVGLTVLIMYNKTYQAYISDSTSIFFIGGDSGFTVNIKEQGVLKKMDILPFFQIYGDSFMFYSEIDSSVINMETDWSYRISFLLSPEYQKQNVRGSVVLVNYNVDSLKLEELRADFFDKIIILHKNTSIEEKSNYIISPGDIEEDTPLFEYGKLFVLLKKYPHGLKIVSFEKER